MTTKLIAATIVVTMAFGHAFGQENPFDLEIETIVGESEDPQRERSVTTSMEIANEFGLSELRSVDINPDDTFGMETVKNTSRVDGGITFSPTPSFTFYSDFGAQMRLAGSDSFDEGPPEFDGRVDEFAVSISPASLPWLKLGVGRTVYRPGTSYAFQTFTDLERDQGVVREHDDPRVVGVDMLTIGAFADRSNATLFLAPGFPIDADAAADYHLATHTRGGIVLTNTIGSLSVSTHAYASNRATRGVGASVSAELGGDTIAYSDMRFGTRDSTEIRETGSHAPDYPIYQVAKSEQTALSGAILGFSYSSETAPDVIGELYVNTAGYGKREFENYVEDAETIRNAYDTAPSVELEGYYRGTMGTLLNDYDPFDFARVLFFLRVSVGDISRDDVQANLMTFYDPITTSAMVSPEVEMSLSERGELILAGEVFAGTSDSLFGRIPTVARFSTVFRYRY
jgi:hypothetical protein